MNVFTKCWVVLLLIVTTGYASVDPAVIQEAKSRYKTAYGNCTMIGGPMDHHMAIVKAYCLKRGDVVLDVGAYIGDYALYYQQLVGPEGMVIAYEANPYVFTYLENRVRTQGADVNVFARRVAVSSVSGRKLQMKLYPNDLGPQSSTVEPALMNEARMPGKTAMVGVMTETLDDLLKNNKIPPVRLIKIDVEGHEHAVIEGAKQLLLAQRPIVIFEYAFVPGQYEIETIRQMEELGYFCYDLKTDERVHPHYEDLETNLLAVPVERVDEFTEVLPQLH